MPHIITELQAEVADHMATMQKLFPLGTKLTFIARMPEKPELDIIASSDNLDEVRWLIHRAQLKGKTGNITGYAPRSS